MGQVSSTTLTTEQHFQHFHVLSLIIRYNSPQSYQRCNRRYIWLTFDMPLVSMVSIRKKKPLNHDATHNNPYSVHSMRLSDSCGNRGHLNYVQRIPRSKVRTPSDFNFSYKIHSTRDKTQLILTSNRKPVTHGFGQ